MILLIELWC